MADQGIAYAIVGDYGKFPTSGNGQVLDVALRGDQNIDPLVSALAPAGYERSIISSEYFGNLTVAQWTALMRALKQRGEVHCIFFTRDIYPLYFSQWLQTLKSRQTLDFPDFAERDNFIHKRFFAAAPNLGRVTVLHYDSIAPGHIGVAFSNAAGIPALPVAMARENRSPTKNEAATLLTAHRARQEPDRSVWAAMAGDSSTPAWSPAYFEVFPDVVATLERRHSSQVAEINERYFSGQEILNVLRPGLRQPGLTGQVAAG